MAKKVLYGLYMTQSFPEDCTFNQGVSASMCVCCSFDEERLKHYCDVFNEANKLKHELFPQTAFESYNVLPVPLC